METLEFPQGVHPNTSEPRMDPLASDPYVTRGAGFADLVLHGPEPPSLWNDLPDILWKASHRRGADKRFTLSVCTMSVLQGLFPILDWWKDYSLKSFRSDLMAGLTLASLSIPQSIGYATLAKLDPQYGLYTSVVPPLVYSVMGTSREIAIGPVAIVSLLLSSMVQKIVDPVLDLASYRKMIFTVTFLTGVFQFVFGLLRLGFLVDFLPHAAIVGFMGGAAIVIGLQQLKGLLGLGHFTSNTDVVSVTKAVWVSVHEPCHPENFFIGCSFLLFILAMRFIGKRNKKLFWVSAVAPVLAVALSTLMVYVTRADKHGVRIIQKVDAGINASSVKQIQLKGPHVVECAKIALICAVIALTEAIAVGRSFSVVNGYKLDGNKEMVAMGFMNVAGSLSAM